MLVAVALHTAQSGRSATICIMTTLAVAIMCALGFLVPVLLEFLPSQRERNVTQARDHTGAKNSSAIPSGSFRLSAAP